MGRVFEAEDPTSGRRVALKLIDLGLDSDSLQIVAAERLGAELQKQLAAIDKRVTAIYETGEMPNYFYIVMEYVEGHDASEIADGNGLPADTATRIAQEVLEVLDNAHHLTTTVEGRQARGIVHGDLKPRNIRVTPNGEVKVLDFGIAKALSLTRNFTQNVFASAQYSSPERMKTGAVDISSDLWGVGVVLYELLTGHAYFQAESGPKLELQIRNYAVMRPLPTDWPEPLRQLVARALDPNPAARYQTAAEFAEAISRFRNGHTDAGETRRTTAPGLDPEATRRVFQGNSTTARAQGWVPVPPLAGNPLPEVTRRTVHAQSNPVASPKAWSLPAMHPPPRRRTTVSRLLRAISIFLLVVFIAVASFGISQYIVWRDARQLAHDLESEKQQNLDAAWQQYAKLASKSHVPFILWSAESAMRNALMSNADRTILKYEEPDGPTVMETEWVHAHNEVAHALELEPGDKTIHGKLRLIDGHLARIRGNARHDSRLIEEARQDFVDAANYMKKSPDPWVGLARLYIYSLHDMEHAEAAFKEAGRRGHDISKRETAQLADGYRYQGEQTMVLADRATSQADAQRYYDMASNDLAHARRLYESILPWHGAAASLKKVDESQSRIQARKSAKRFP
jgi:serine/threonine protein kinase